MQRRSERPGTEKGMAGNFESLERYFWVLVSRDKMDQSLERDDRETQVF
jgi:hypothetical protein